MKRKLPLLIVVALLLSLGILSLPYLAWRLVAWLLMDDEER